MRSFSRHFITIQSSSPRTSCESRAGAVLNAAATLGSAPEVLSRTLGRGASSSLISRTNSSSADYLRVRIVGTTTTLVLEELGAANDDDAAWATATVNLNSYAGQSIRILVEAADASGASLVEAAIDDVRITQQ